MYVVREMTDQPGRLDCFSIDWNGKWVYRCLHPWMAEMTLRILEDMGDPHEWKGDFATALRRRVNRLYRVVPCSCTHGRKESRGGKYKYQMCKRKGEDETPLGEPHETRRDAFDKWLGELEL
tara:strand:- start:81 stop:446 length:366 start_codon:yes stop_codon:yes gene_type:complete